MIRFIEHPTEYITITEDYRTIFKEEVDCGDNPFLNKFVNFNAFEFDKIYDENFYQGLINFLTKRSKQEFTFYTLLPDPKDYFFKNFSKFSIAQIETTRSYEEYMDLLLADPGGSPADALMHNGETVAIFTPNSMWGMIGSKDLEIGIVGFCDRTTQEEFITSFKTDSFIGIEARSHDLDGPTSLSLETLKIHLKMIENYSEQ